MKRAFIIHGWDGNPETGWFPWLRKELEDHGFEVHIPQMPDTEEPRINKWVPAIKEAVGVADSDTYFVGHSMGCQAIIRYLETLPEEQSIGGAIFVSGFFRPLTGLETDEERDVDNEWANTHVDTDRVRDRLGKSFALFSDDDPWVSVENAEDFQNRLDSEVLIQHGQSHFNEDAGFRKLPIVLEKLIEISNS